MVPAVVKYRYPSKKPSKNNIRSNFRLEFQRFKFYLFSSKLREKLGLAPLQVDDKPKVKEVVGDDGKTTTESNTLRRDVA